MPVLRPALNPRLPSLFRLAVPIMIEQILRTLMGTVNTLMLSQYSDNAVAAVGISNQILNVVVMGAAMIASGTAIVLNQKLGAGKEKEAAELAMNSVGMALIAGAFMTLPLLLFARSFVTLTGLESSLIPDASSYLRIVGAASIFPFTATTLSVCFRCRGNTRTPMLVIVLSNTVNLIGSYIVIMRPFETPLEGVTGVAAVRVVSEGIGFLFLAALLRCGVPNGRFRNLIHIRKQNLRTIARLGFLSGSDGVSYTLTQLFTISFLTAFGAIQLSTKVYVQTVNMYAHMAGFAVGQAAAIVSGHLLGAGRMDDARHLIRKVSRIVFLCNVLVSTLFFLLADPIMDVFTKNEAIVSLAKTLFLIDIFICSGRALNHSFNLGLRSAGYVFYPTLIASASMWLIGVGLGYTLSIGLGLGIVGLWLEQMSDEWLRGILSAILWMKGKWQKSLLIEADDCPGT
jgi:putative MATE family efflux protein